MSVIRSGIQASEHSESTLANKENKSPSKEKGSNKNNRDVKQPYL